MAEFTYLGENAIYSTVAEEVGINLNELIIGGTGRGKSWSVVYPRLLHMSESSVIVPVAKKDVANRFKKLFAKKGYETQILDFISPHKSTIGYDLLDSVETFEDATNLARSIVDQSSDSGYESNAEYWNSAATSIITALIWLVKLNEKFSGAKAGFADVGKLVKNLEMGSQGAGKNIFTTNLDYLFEEAERIFPGNEATQMWKSFSGIADVTASGMFSVANTSMDKIITESILELSRKDKKLRFQDMGKKRTAVFIITSPVNKSLHAYLNLMYADMFKQLFESAEANKNGRLDVPVHIICDDFACGGKIPNFDKYLSVFRAAGISATILLQSESQLTCMYGEGEARTIIDNCDTMVYMGGTDSLTCRNVAERANRSLQDIFQLPLEHVIIFRPGTKPIFTRRYQILEDSCYQELMADNL